MWPIQLIHRRLEAFRICFLQSDAIIFFCRQGCPSYLFLKLPSPFSTPSFLFTISTLNRIVESFLKTERFLKKLETIQKVEIVRSPSL